MSEELAQIVTAVKTPVVLTTGSVVWYQSAEDWVLILTIVLLVVSILEKLGVGAWIKSKLKAKT